MLISGTKKFFQMVLFWNWLIGWFTWNVLAQVNQDCDYEYYINWGQTHLLESPGYPSFFYPPNKVCRWRYTSPPGTVLSITCNPVDIPDSFQCQSDRLVISRTGDYVLSDGTSYCGTSPIQTQSVTNAMTLGLISSPNSNGGLYRCVITPIGGGGSGTTPPTTTSTARPNECDCGWRQQRRIVGGTETKVNEFPFMAALWDTEKRTLWCGASIISDRYAVTAAHCLYRKSYTIFELVVGGHDIKATYDTASTARYRLEGFSIHDSYNTRTQQNDIAIVRTSARIYFSMNVGPICLPYRYTAVSFTNAIVTTMGWGSIYFTGPTSDTLQSVNLTVVSQQTCQDSYTESNEVITPSQICTYAPDKDACTFDSGGPIVWYDNFNTNRYQLLGVVSYGKACASNAPGVNTNVPSYVSWIVSQTPDASYCFK